MALSVIKLGDGNKYAIYDSTKERCILSGSEEEMFTIKHNIEQLEQNKDNHEYFEKYKATLINMLVSSGISEADATRYLKKQMPYLWE